jgi:hypothetical protein
VPTEADPGFRMIGPREGCESTLLLKTMQVYVLFHHRASHSFISCKITNRLYIMPSKLDARVTVSTPLRENLDINNVYRGVRLFIEDYELRVDVMLLKLDDFDLILGMD